MFSTVNFTYILYYEIRLLTLYKSYVTSMVDKSIREIPM